MFCARSKCVLSRVTCHMLREVYRLFDSTKVGQDACLAWSMPCGCSILERICDCPRSVHRTDVSLLQHLFVIVWFIFRFVKETARENYVAKSPWWHLRHLSLDGLFIWLGCLWLNVLISVWSLENSLSRCRTRKDKTWTSTSPGSVLPRTGLSPQRTMRLSRSTLGTWVLMVFTPTNSPLLLSAVSLDPRFLFFPLCRPS